MRRRCMAMAAAMLIAGAARPAPAPPEPAPGLEPAAVTALEKMGAYLRTLHARPERGRYLNYAVRQVAYAEDHEETDGNFGTAEQSVS